MLQIAKILKSNGTDGAVLIGMRDIDARDIDLSEPVFIEFDGLPVPFFIESVQPKGVSKAVVRLTDVLTLEDAEEIVGRAVFVEGEWEEEEDDDFVGWTLLDKGTVVGEITGTEPIPGNFCLYVGEKMIPLHEDFVIGVDEERRELNLDLPQGL